MTWKDAAERVFKDGFLVAVDPLRREAELVEKGQMTVILYGLPPEVAVVSMTGVDHLKCVREGPLLRKCDYLILGHGDGKDYALLVELKKTLEDELETKPMEQLWMTHPIVRYLEASSARVGGPTGPLQIKQVLWARQAGPSVFKHAVRVRPNEPVETRRWRGMRVPVFMHERLSLAGMLAATDEGPV